MIDQKRRRRRELTHKRILAAATEIAREEGWPGVTMRKIADRIDYSHAALYAYFATKEALLGALLRQGLALLRASLQAAREAADTPEGAVLSFADAYWDFAWRQPELYQVMHGIAGVAFGSDDTRLEGERAAEPVVAAVAAYLAERGLPPGDAAQKTALLWSGAHGVVALTMAGRFSREEGAALVHQAARDALVAWSAGAPVAGRATDGPA